MFHDILFALLSCNTSRPVKYLWLVEIHIAQIAQSTTMRLAACSDETDSILQRH